MKKLNMSEMFISVVNNIVNGNKRMCSYKQNIQTNSQR